MGSGYAGHGSGAVYNNRAVDQIHQRVLDPDRPVAERRAHDTIADIARYRDIALRLVSGQPRSQIMHAHDLTIDQYRRLETEPGMVEAYQRASDLVFGKVTAALADEKVTPLVEHARLEARAYLLLTKIYQRIDAKIEADTATPLELKVGADSADSLITRGMRMRYPELNRQGGGVSVNTNVQLNQQSVSVLGEAMRECGVDLSHLLESPRDPRGETGKAPPDANGVVVDSDDNHHSPY